jgi:hypothetical protein
LIPDDGWKEIELKTKDFLDQKRVFFEGDYFTCRDIIKFTANKLGGAHYDLKRDNRWAKLDKAASYMKFGGPNPYVSAPPTHLYLVLEPNGSEILSGMHIELIAAATSLIQVRLDGSPVLELKSKKSLRSRVEEFLGKNRRRVNLVDY